MHPASETRPTSQLLPELAKAQGNGVALKFGQLVECNRSLFKRGILPLLVSHNMKFGEFPDSQQVPL